MLPEILWFLWYPIVGHSSSLALGERIAAEVQCRAQTGNPTLVLFVGATVSASYSMVYRIFTVTKYDWLPKLLRMEIQGYLSGVCYQRLLFPMIKLGKTKSSYGNVL